MLALRVQHVPLCRLSCCPISLSICSSLCHHVLSHNASPLSTFSLRKVRALQSKADKAPSLQDRSLHFTPTLRTRLCPRGTSNALQHPNNHSGMLLHSHAQICVLNVVDRHRSVSRPHAHRHVLRSNSRQQSADRSRQQQGLARELRSQACVLMARYKQADTRDIETSRASGDGTSAVVVMSLLINDPLLPLS